MNKNYSLETKKPENQTSLKAFKPKFQMYSTLHKLERTICMIPGFRLLCQFHRNFQHIQMYLPQSKFLTCTCIKPLSPFLGKSSLASSSSIKHLIWLWPPPLNFLSPLRRKIHVHVHCSNVYVPHYLGGGEREQHTCNQHLIQFTNKNMSNTSLQYYTCPTQLRLRYHATLTLPT